MTQPPGTPSPSLGCRGGHDQPRNPTHHPVWGLVPSRTSVVVGVIVILVVLLLENWLVDWLLLPTLLALGAALLVSLVIQYSRGHRGSCLAVRTVRWWLGPIGSLFDPIDMG